ncbi:MAG: retroviral-like aspartic protease family protein, partial [Alkalinema sp. FL-bin-369]|nr:retroviral-like aspartic protease family protein [Leptolyngbyaceae cyanobacterium LF-bin-369]
MMRLTGLNGHLPNDRSGSVDRSWTLGLTGMDAGRWMALLTLVMICGACQNQSTPSQTSVRSSLETSESLAPSEKASAPKLSQAPLKVVLPAAKSPAIAATAKVTKPVPRAIQIMSSPSYQQALDKAESAASISASAQSPEDWKLVAAQWKDAIALMKQVSPNDTNRTSAMQEIARMEVGLDRSQQNIDRFKGNNSNIATGPVTEPRRGIYRAAIKYYSSGIPVVDVTFNGRERFEMMVDTGASATMITESMAQRLRVKTVGSVEAMTPSGKTQFKVGYIDSMVVGGGSLQSFPVAIGPVALLGHDFFGDCNISIKRNQNIVEFSQCQS